MLSIDSVLIRINRGSGFCSKLSRLRAAAHNFAHLPPAAPFACGWQPLFSEFRTSLHFGTLIRNLGHVCGVAFPGCMKIILRFDGFRRIVLGFSIPRPMLRVLWHLRDSWGLRNTVLRCYRPCEPSVLWCHGRTLLAPVTPSGVERTETGASGVEGRRLR